MRTADELVPVAIARGVFHAHDDGGALLLEFLQPRNSLSGRVRPASTRGAAEEMPGLNVALAEALAKSAAAELRLAREGLVADVDQVRVEAPDNLAEARDIKALIAD